MPAPKILNGKMSYELTAGTYKLAYKKNSGGWNEINALKFEVPADRKASINLTVKGKEEDV